MTNFDPTTSSPVTQGTSGVNPGTQVSNPLQQNQSVESIDFDLGFDSVPVTENILEKEENLISYKGDTSIPDDDFVINLNMEENPQVQSDNQENIPGNNEIPSIQEENKGITDPIIENGGAVEEMMPQIEIGVPSIQEENKEITDPIIENGGAPVVNTPTTFFEVTPESSLINETEEIGEKISVTENNITTEQPVQQLIQPENTQQTFDSSQISALLGDDPLGMLNSEPLTTQTVSQQTIPTQGLSPIQTQITANSPLNVTTPQNIQSPLQSEGQNIGGKVQGMYVPTMDSLNQTVQNLQSQQGVQAGFINQETPVSVVPTQGNIVSLDQLGDMSFTNPPISQIQPQFQESVQMTPNQQVQQPKKSGGSKGMVIAFLLLLPCVALVIYFMMPDLFQPLIDKFKPTVTKQIDIPVENSLGEVPEQEQKEENAEGEGEKEENHGTAEEKNESIEESLSEDEQENGEDNMEEEENFTGGYEEIKEISDDFFGSDDEISPFQDEEDEEMEFSDLSLEDKTVIKNTLQDYHKQGETRLKTAKKEGDKNIIKYATFITSQTQNLLDDLENDTFDLNKYESSLKIIKTNLDKIDAYINGEEE